MKLIIAEKPSAARDIAKEEERQEWTARYLIGKRGLSA